MSIAALRLQAAALVDMLESVQDEMASLAPPAPWSDVRATVRAKRPYDHRDWADAVEAGESFASIGRRSGFSREAVRRWVTQWSPQSVKRGKRADEWRRTEAQFAYAASRARPCRVCGYWSLRGRYTCSPRCAEAWQNSSVRRIVSPEYREQHERLIAGTIYLTQ